MPLPAALQARLAKRGIVEEEVKPDPKPVQAFSAAPSKPEEVEEVFAEDYDDPSKPDVPVPYPMDEDNEEPAQETDIQEESDNVDRESPVFFETTACPNRLNPYHQCVNYCKKKYGMREWAPDPDMIKRRDRMLRKYPLPTGWREVGDCDTGRFYYWNIETDEVSWLSPAHPKAQISQTAEALGLIGKIGNLDSDGEEAMDTSFGAYNSDSGSETSLSDEEDYIEILAKSKKPGRPARQKVDDLDPMDPAAYSDIPRGGWTEGLDQRGKAKTGVDTTASGPLFQQRPYPSPGEILRANQDLKKKK